MPLFSLVIFLTFYEKFSNHYQWLAAICNLVAGLLTLYLKHLFPSSTFFSLTTIIIVIFFSVIALRLRVYYALAVTLTYVILYQVNLLYNYDFEATEIIYHSFGIWIAELTAISCSYVLEYVTRRLFIQNKIIETQKLLLEKESEKSEQLLLNILPNSIAVRLKTGELIADSYKNISVLFADICDFTSFSKNKDPQDIVNILDSIFTTFDSLTDKYCLEKIKTIGDAYMVVAGLPHARNDHAEVIAQMALEMIDIKEQFLNNFGLNIRIGISSGPAVAGIIGKKKFHYDIWGDTVNTASRMESHGMPGKIQVSEKTYNLLKENYIFDDRGFIDVKGVGKMRTYFLIKSCEGLT